MWVTGFTPSPVVAPEAFSPQRGADGEADPLRQPPGLHQGPRPPLTASRAPGPAGPPPSPPGPPRELSKPHGAAARAGIGCLCGWGRPSSSRSPPPSPVSGTWHGDPICFQSGPACTPRPSSGLRRVWEPPRGAPGHPPRPLRGSAGRGQGEGEGRLLCARTPPPPWGAARASFCPSADLLSPGVCGEPSAAASGILPLHPLPWPRAVPGRAVGAR